MKARMMLSAIVVVAAFAATASAVVVEVQVTPAYIKEQPQAFSIKAELRQDGLIHFKVTRHLSQPRYHVTIFRVRQGGDVVGESYSPSFVRQQSATYYFSVSPKYLAESDVEIHERAFGGDAGREDAFPGGIDYKIRLREFAPSATRAGKEIPMRMLTAVSAPSVVLSGTASSLPPSSDSGRAIPLADAIKAFNKEAADHHIGKDETPITEAEVIAVIRAWERPNNPAVSDNLYNAFKQIAETRLLPPGAAFDSLGGGWDPGGAFVYDVWWVRIEVPKEDGGPYSIRIRERMIRSRTLQEELVQTEKRLQECPPEPGKFRLEERVEDLKARIAKMKAK